MSTDGVSPEKSCTDGMGEASLASAPGSGAVTLPVASLPGTRRDAQRNRERVLCASQQLVSQSGVVALDIRDVARTAGVGVGTIYRRFGDKAGLLAALLDERERRFQDSLISGPAPLGPGASPRERLVAFLHELAVLTEQNIELLCALQRCRSGAHFHVGAYKAWKLHATVLLADAAPGIDAGWFADLLLAPLTADLFQHQRDELGISAERLCRNLTVTVDAIVAAAPRPVAG